MKLVCSQSDLRSHLSLVSRAVPSRPTHPVLGNVLLKADPQQGKVRLIAFDLSLGIQTSFAAQVTTGGEVTLPAKIINEIVSRLSEGEITITYEPKEQDAEREGVLITLTSTSGRYQLRGMEAEEFPELPVIEEGTTLMLPVEVLGEGLRGALFAASADETKQILTGVHLCTTTDSLEFAATDGHRLAVVETQLETDNQPGEEVAVTIPARGLRELERMLSGHQGEELVKLWFDESQVVFELGEQRLTSRRLEGAYPAYGQLIPQQFERKMSLERKRLLSGLELVAVLADANNSVVKFSLDGEKQELSLSVNAKDVGNAKESMPVEISGDSIDIAFNVKYLMDGLKSLPANEIQMHLNAPTQPVIFTPLGGVKMTYLVMPVQIR